MQTKTTRPLKIKDCRLAFFEGLSPRERWTPSEWAEKAPRKLREGLTSEPGDWKNDRTPYLVGIMDACVEEAIEEVVVLKGAQIGYSEAVRNVLGYWIDLDPGPCLVVMPNQKSAEELIDERIMPLVRDTPAIARHQSPRAWDTKKHAIKLDTMSIYLAWAGSSQGLKSRPIRYLILEEPDEYPTHSGTGGDPISKALKRITTYSDKGRARVLVGGTPTTRRGNTFKRWEMCADKRHFWLPCPHCHQYQQLSFKNRLKWPDVDAEDAAAKANRIETENLAYYECEHCKKEIRDHHKPDMLRRGVWASEDQVVTSGGRVVGPRPSSKRVGFHISSLYSPWVTFSKLAAEFLLAKDDPGTLMDFVNQRLAEPFEEQISAPKVEVVQRKAEEARDAQIKVDLVPSWASLLVATVDTQKDGFWYVIGAWGYRYKFQLIRYGYLHTFDEVYKQCLMTPYPVEGGMTANPRFLLIDSGGGTQGDEFESRTDEVYRFAERAPGIILPIKGASQKQVQTVRQSVLTRKSESGVPVVIHTLDTQRLKDELSRHMNVPVGQEGELLLNESVGEDFVKQMTSEHKIITDPRTGEMRWSRKSKDNHLWDCMVYQFAGADPQIGSVNLIPHPDEVLKQQEEQRKAYEAQAAQSRSSGSSWATNYRKW